MFLLKKPLCYLKYSGENTHTYIIVAAERDQLKYCKELELQQFFRKTTLGIYLVVYIHNLYVHNLLILPTFLAENKRYLFRAYMDGVVVCNVVVEIPH